MAIALGTIAPASPPHVGTSANSVTHSYSVTTTADTDVVAVFVTVYNSDIVTNGRATLTWDGGSITELDWHTQAGSIGDDGYIQAFLVTSPGSPGSHALVVTLPGAGGSGTRPSMSIAVPLESVDMGALPTAFVIGQGTTGTAVSVSVPTTVGNVILTVGATYDMGQTAHTGSILGQYNGGADGVVFAAWNAMSTVADTNPEVVGWTQTSSDDWMIGALDFVPAATGEAHDETPVDDVPSTDDVEVSVGRVIDGDADPVGITDTVDLMFGRVLTITDTIAITDSASVSDGSPLEDTMFVGDDAVTGVYIGDVAVTAVYLGDNLVWEAP